MEIVDNAHSYTAPVMPATEAKEVSNVDAPMDTNEAVKGQTLAEPPFSMYEQVNNCPYTLKYLQMDLFNDRTMFQDGETMKMARYIDSFVSDEIERKRLTDTIDSYCSIINNLKQTLNIDMNETSVSILNKLYAFVKKYRGVTAYGV